MTASGLSAGQLADIRARAEAATDGPWFREVQLCLCGHPQRDHQRGSTTECVTQEALCPCMEFAALDGPAAGGER